MSSGRLLQCTYDIDRIRVLLDQCLDVAQQAPTLSQSRLGRSSAVPWGHSTSQIETRKKLSTTSGIDRCTIAVMQTRGLDSVVAKRCQASSKEFPK